METLYVVEPMDPVDTAILERWVRGHGGTAADIVELPDPAAGRVSIGPLSSEKTEQHTATVPPTNVGSEACVLVDGYPAIAMFDALSAASRSSTPAAATR